MPHYLTIHHSPGVTSEDFQRSVPAVLEGKHATFFQSYANLVNGTIVNIYDGESAEAVGRELERIGFPYDEIQEVPRACQRALLRRRRRRLQRRAACVRPMRRGSAPLSCGAHGLAALRAVRRAGQSGAARHGSRGRTESLGAQRDDGAGTQEDASRPSLPCAKRWPGTAPAAGRSSTPRSCPPASLKRVTGTQCAPSTPT